MDYTEADVASLAAKLDGLDLTDAERAAFAAGLVPSDDEEVSGFAETVHLYLNFGQVVSQRALFHFQPRFQPGTGPVGGTNDCRI